MAARSIVNLAHASTELNSNETITYPLIFLILVSKSGMSLVATNSVYRADGRIPPGMLRNRSCLLKSQ